MKWTLLYTSARRLYMGTMCLLCRIQGKLDSTIFFKIQNLVTMNGCVRVLSRARARVCGGGMLARVPQTSSLRLRDDTFSPQFCDNHRKLCSLTTQNNSKILNWTMKYCFIGAVLFKLSSHSNIACSSSLCLPVHPWVWLTGRGKFQFAMVSWSYNLQESREETKKKCIRLRQQEVN